MSPFGEEEEQQKPRRFSKKINERVAVVVYQDR
jgi:hypothetical protein